MTYEKWIKLTPDQQRIKVAELCGWRWMRYYWYLDAEHTTPTEVCRLPNYLNDLNIMYEAEQILIDKNLYVAFAIHLCNMRGGHNTVAHATAAQRAEAFVLTMEPET